MYRLSIKQEPDDTSEESDSCKHSNINNDNFQTINSVSAPSTSVSVPSSSVSDPSTTVSLPGPSFSVPDYSSPSVRISKKLEKKKEMLWRKNNLILNHQQLPFLGDSKFHRIF